jgi:multidrug efflux system outer membrane protein
MRQSIRRALTVLLASGLVGGCTLEPHYKRPDLPVPPQWPLPENSAPMAADDSTPTSAASQPGTSSADTPWEIGWRDFFTDPQLQQLIAQALANNRDLRVAVLNVELARAQYHVQRASLLPQVDATGSYTREKLAPALQFGFPIAPGESIDKTYEAGIGVTSWEIDLFGKVQSQTHAAFQQYLAQEEARRSAQLSLIAQVASAYLTLEADRELDRLALETVKSQEASYDLTRKRHQSGAVSGLDLAQAQTTVEQARADAARYEGNVAQDLDALALLVGGSVEGARLPQDLDANVTGLGPLPPGMPSSVLLRRPDILQAEHQLRAANADIGAARAAFFPSIDLTGSLGSASETMSGLFKAGTFTWQLIPQATLPIFHGGALVGNLSAARTQQKIAVAQYEKAIQSGFRDVADALALTGSLDRQHRAQQALVDAASQAYELSQQRYKTGADSYLTLLTAQQSYYGAQQGLISTRLAEQSNRVTLYKALGGGWQEHSGQTASN